MIGLYAYRMERGTVSEVPTTSLWKIIENSVEMEKREHKILPRNDSQAYPIVGPNNQLIPKAPLKVSQTISLAHLEIKLDGPTRFLVLPDNRLLVIG